MNIVIAGPGCANCARLEANVAQALKQMGDNAPDAQVQKITDYVDIAALGVMVTPGLVIDGRVVVSGRVPAVDEIVAVLSA